MIAYNKNAKTDLPTQAFGKFERILEAALAIFASKGYHESKISEIAQAAGVADGTIYTYFKSKDDLLISLFESHLTAINKGLKEELDKLDKPRAKLERIIRYHLELAKDNPPLTQFITIELRRSALFMKEYAKGQFTEYLNQFTAVIDEGKANGSFRPEISTGIVRQILFGALDNACVTWVNNPNRHPDDLRLVGDTLIDLVVRAITTEP